MNLTAVPDQPQYLALLDEIKIHIRQSRLQAAHAVNRELIQLYWWLGKTITENLWYMRQFYLAYRDHEFLQQLVREIPWGQNLVILARIKELKARKYYLQSTQEMG